MAHRGAKQSDSDAVNRLMKELHLKVYRGHEKVDKAEASPSTSQGPPRNRKTSLASSEKGSAVAQVHTGEKTQSPRSVYTWHKGQLAGSGSPHPDSSEASSHRAQQLAKRTGSPLTGDCHQLTQALPKRAISPLTVDTQLGPPCVSSNPTSLQTSTTIRASPSNVVHTTSVAAVVHTARPIPASASQISLTRIQTTYASPNVNPYKWTRQPQITQPNTSPNQNTPVEGPHTSKMSSNPQRPATSPLLVSTGLAEGHSSLDSQSVAQVKSPAALHVARWRRSSLHSPGMLATSGSSISPASSSFSPMSASPGTESRPSLASPVCANTEPVEIAAADQSSVSRRDGCSCHRPPGLVLCKACGETVQGRIRNACTVHSKQIFLMDFSCCPKCLSKNLKEIPSK